MILSSNILNIVMDIMDKDQIIELNNRLEKLTEKLELADIAVTNTVSKKNADNTRPPQGKSQVRAGVNTWKDSGEAKDDIDEKIIRSKINREPRPASKKVERACSICHKLVKVPQVLSETHYYRCERCSGR